MPSEATRAKELAGLTDEQSAMLASCLALGAAWVTGRGGENEALLERWSKEGWAEETVPPVGLTTLRAYHITPAGRRALQESHDAE